MPGNNRKTETSGVETTTVEVEMDEDENSGCCCGQSETDDSGSEAGSDQDQAEEGDDDMDDEANDQVVMDAMGVVIHRRRSHVSRCWTSVKKYYQIFQQSVKRLVEHKYFQQGLLGAILINTLSMGIEYHNQVIKNIFHFFFLLCLSFYILIFFGGPFWPFMSSRASRE